MVGQDVTASQLNSNLRDGVNFLLGPPLAQLYQATAQTVPTGSTTFTAITLDGSIVDTYNGHSTSSSNSRYVSQQTGWYWVSATVAYAANTAGTRAIDIWANGAFVLGSGAHTQTGPLPNSHVWGGTAAGLFYLPAGSYVEIYTWQDSGAALATNPAGTGDVCSAMNLYFVHS